MKTIRKCFFAVAMILLCAVSFAACDVKEINLEGTEITVASGETVKMKIGYAPGLAKKAQFYAQYEDSDIAYAKVVEEGRYLFLVVTGRAKGISTVSAVGRDGVRGNCVVTVTGGSGKDVNEIKSAFTNVGYKFYSNDFGSLEDTACIASLYFYQTASVSNGFTSSNFSIVCYADDATASEWYGYYTTYSPSTKYVLDGHIIYKSDDVTTAIYEAVGGGSGGSNNGRELSSLTAAQIKTALGTAGYTVDDESAAGITVLVAIKGIDMLQVVIFPSVALAIEAKSTYDIAANILGQTCKRDKNIIYYGTTAAITAFESIS